MTAAGPLYRRTASAVMLALVALWFAVLVAATVAVGRALAPPSLRSL